MNEDRTAAGVRHIGMRLEDLASDRRLLGRVLGWAAANWILDAAALWVFLRAFGASTDVDALIVAFGLVNVLAVIPITPGGLGDHRRRPAAGPGRFRPDQIDCGAGVGHLSSRPVLLPDPARRSPVRHACESGRGASSGASGCVVCATSRPIHRTTNAPSTSRSASPSSAGHRRRVVLVPGRQDSGSQPRSRLARSRVTATTTGSYCRSA